MNYKTIFQDKVIQSIKVLRVKHGISQAKLAEMLGISSGLISNIENPRYPHKYTIKQIKIFCDAVNEPIENIFLNNPKEVNISNLIDNIIEYEQ